MVDRARTEPGRSPRKTDRIVVVGTTGAGKTTLAREIARALDARHVEFDAYRHGRNWTETPDEVFRERLRCALKGHTWVGDGNYRIARSAVWPRATLLVWVDYPLCVVMWRLFRRTVSRGVFRLELWNGNREKLWRQFLTRDSLFLWALRTHGRHRQEIPRDLEQPEFSHLGLVRLRSPKATKEWLGTLSCGRRGAGGEG